MALTGIFDDIHYVLNDFADKRLEHLPLMSVFSPLFIIATYYMFVFKWGPNFMENRKPYKLNKTLIAYNAFQMIACLTLIIAAVPNMSFSLWYCNPIVQPHLEHYLIKWVIYGYYMLKISDLLDTVFFVLKKNQRQITVLHVFHHSFMIGLSWCAARLAPSGHSVYGPLMNSMVHVVMYGYYLLTVFEPSYKKSLWWKKQITHLQLFQFGVGSIVYGAPLLNGCSYPNQLLYIILTGDVLITALFLNFYYQNYIKKKST